MLNLVNTLVRKRKINHFYPYPSNQNFKDWSAVLASS